jgi:hypothetical protein
MTLEVEHQALEALSPRQLEFHLSVKLGSVGGGAQWSVFSRLYPKPVRSGLDREICQATVKC